MVGPAARASGVPIDIRTDYPSGMYRHYPVRKVVLEKGDVFARSYIRYVEILNSFHYIREQLEIIQGGETFTSVKNMLPADTLVLSMTEGWRGEIIHAAVTDQNGKLIISSDTGYQEFSRTAVESIKEIRRLFGRSLHNKLPK